MYALLKGEKFIPAPPPLSDDSLLSCIQDYIRQARIRYYFYSIRRTTTTINADIPKLWVRNPSWNPPKSSDVLERYYEEVRTRGVALLNQTIQTTPYFSQTSQKIKQSISTIKATPGIKIFSADKNLGLTITTDTWYQEQATIKWLSDTNTYKIYESIDNLPLLWTTLRQILADNECLFTKSHEDVLTKTAKYILQLERNPIIVGNFYLTIKVHKTPPSTRPIVNTRNTPTYHASKFLHYELRPLMEKGNSYLQNSQSLIRILETHRADCPVVLLAADIKDLYPSIPIDDGLLAIYHTLKHLAHKDSAYISLIMSLSRFVLRNNIFKFLDKYYIQINGTAMGTSFAVAYANIYLNVLEIEIWSEFTKQVNYNSSLYPLLLRRFIDDIFGIFTSTDTLDLYLKIYNSARSSIKLIPTSGSSVDFLDLTIFIGPRFQLEQRLDIKLYQKPSNKYLYIPMDSYHARNTFANLIQSELRRYRLSCVHDFDYILVKDQFYNRLLNRDYKQTYLDPLFTISLERSDLVNQLLSPEQPKKKAPTVFKITRTPRFSKTDITNLLHIPPNLMQHPHFEALFYNRQPIVCYQRTSNLKELLVLTSRKKETLPSPEAH